MGCTRLIAAALVLMFIVLSGFLRVTRGGELGSEVEGGVERLIAMAESAKSQFQPYPADQVVRTRARLQRAVKQLNAALTRTNPANRQQWKEYLRWDSLVDELERSETPDRGPLEATASRLFQNYGSLEMPAFTRVRDALMAYLTAREMAENERLADAYATQLDRLVERLTEYDREGTYQQAQQVGALVGWLENARQADELVAAVRRQYGRPNFYAELSEELVSEGVTTEVDEITDVRDCILGTALFGKATMRGRTVGRLTDHPEAANLQLVLSGIVHSNNVGYNRGVTIHSRGVTRVEATKDVLLNPTGFDAAGANARCATSSTIDGISAKSRMIERIAWKRTMRSKGAAEQIASRNAERRVAAQMDDRADKLLAQARAQYDEHFRNPLLRRGEFPQEMHLRTRRGALTLTMRQANASQLAAPTPPPPVVTQRDLAVRVHESLVSNLSRALLGGVRLTDEQLAEILLERTGEVPAELEITPDKSKWAITFSPVDPVSAVFADNTIRFAVRGRRFELDATVVRNTLEMSAVYTFEQTATGAHFVRQGNVSVEYLDARGQLRPDQIAVRTVMRDKFEALFAPEFNTTGMKLPGRWEHTGTLHLQEIVSSQGWLSLAWLKGVPPEAVADVAKLAQSN
jgi:hypothetical protein